MQAVILCGGKGTRLRAAVADRPKSMADVNGKPFLWFLLQNLKRSGIQEVVLCTGYMSHSIEEYFHDGKDFGITIRYSREDEPLGTGGALKHASDLLTDEFWVLNGDTYLEIEWLQMYQQHQAMNSTATIAVTTAVQPARYGNVMINENSKIISFTEKHADMTSALINAGVYLLNKSVVQTFPDGNLSIEHDMFPKLVWDGNLYAFITNGVFIDIGLPETYMQFKKICRGLR